MFTLKQIIEDDFPIVRKDLSDYWNKNDYKSFVMALLDHTKRTKKEQRSGRRNEECYTSSSHCNSNETVFNFFNQAITDYRIQLFVESVDPTSIMEIECIDKCDKFIKRIKDGNWHPITKAAIRETEAIVREIYRFCEVLDEYISYLGCNMRSVNPIQAPTAMVPKYREENIQWALDFEKKTLDYRNQLANIYQKIYNYTEY